MKVISEYVAPWVLSNEEIPIHLVWDPRFEYDFIRIKTPEGIIIKDLFNVEKCEEKGSWLIIKKLKTSNYLGFLALSKEIPQETHTKKEIKIEFVSSNNIKHSHIFIANIYRPLLTLTEEPKPVTLSDDSDFRNLLNVPLKLHGFGRIRTRFDISTGGKFRTRAEPLYREVTRRMISTFKFGEIALEQKREIQIDALHLQEMTKAIIERMKKGELPLDLEKEDLDGFQKWISDKKNQTQLLDLVSRHLENLLIDSLLFYFEKYPTDYIELAQGKPATLIERATREVKMRIRYWDSLGNEYEPVEVEIPIEDIRKDEKKEIELPINIHWEQEIINPLAEKSKCPV